jgi:hypothetical protein
MITPMVWVVHSLEVLRFTWIIDASRFIERELKSSGISRTTWWPIFATDLCHAPIPLRGLLLRIMEPVLAAKRRDLFFDCSSSSNHCC